MPPAGPTCRLRRHAPPASRSQASRPVRRCSQTRWPPSKAKACTGVASIPSGVRKRRCPGSQRCRPASAVIQGWPSGPTANMPRPGVSSSRKSSTRPLSASRRCRPAPGAPSHRLPSAACAIQLIDACGVASTSESAFQCRDWPLAGSSRTRPAPRLIQTLPLRSSSTARVRPGTASGNGRVTWPVAVSSHSTRPELPTSQTPPRAARAIPR